MATGGAPHDLGEVQTPAEMAQHTPPGGQWEKFTLSAAADKALAALIGSGPNQTPPHASTAITLREGLARLRDYALAGDADAMRWLGFVLSEAVADLGEMARRKPEIVCAWSRKRNVVPVLAGKNKGHREQLARDLDAFAVGELSPYRVNPPRGKKVPDVSTPANALAGDLCQHLAVHRFSVSIMKRPVPKWAHKASALPELSKNTWEKWAEAAWECILDATDRHPESCDALKPLGAKGARKAGLQTPRTKATNVKAEIRQTLREAMRNLAAAPTFTDSE